MWINNILFKLGTDPEVFVQDRKTKQFVGAHGMLKGTKVHPQKLGFGIKGQVDGMALEFNTCPQGLSGNFAHVVARGKDVLNIVAGKVGCRIVVQSTVEFDEEVWAATPDMFKVLGCEQDYNAWTMKVNDPPNPEVTYRTGGGHLHTGWGRDFEIDDAFRRVCGAYVREQDATNGVASVLYDGDVGRRELYGKAGAFRPKSYGVEYRTLSNSWVRNKELSKYVADRSFQAAMNMMEGVLMQTPEVESIINDNKVEEAKYFLKHNKISLPPAKYRVV